MAPVPRIVHLMGVSLFAITYALVRLVVVVMGLAAFIDVRFAWDRLPGLFLVLLVSSFAFIGLGLIAAILPVVSPERGAEATNIFQSVLLLVSGIYYPVDVLPRWIQPLSVLSPATHALSASRKILGIGRPPEGLAGVQSELLVLAAMGLIFVPLGLWTFGRAEQWAKRTGKLKRAG